MTLTFTLHGQVVPNSMYRPMRNKRTGGTFIPNKRWAAWREDAAKQLLYQKRAVPWPLYGPLKLSWIFTHEDHRTRDGGNLLKSLETLLESTGVVANDGQIVDWEGHTTLEPNKATAGAEIRLETLSTTSSMAVK